MQLRQIFIAAAVLAETISLPFVQAGPVQKPWAFVQFATFNGSSALIANPALTAAALHTVSQAEGFVRGYQGRQFENPNIFHLSFEWTSIHAQTSFERSAKYREVAAVLKSANANGQIPTSVHLAFVGDYTISFDSPFSEIVLVTLADGRTEQELVTAVANVYTGALNVAPGIHVPGTRAPIIEKPRSYFLTGGWDHVSDHTAAVAVEPAKSLVAAVAALVEPEYSVTHAAMTKIA